MADTVRPLLDGPSVPLGELPGVWSRTLYVRGDGTVDDRTCVTWVQAGRSYVDLRRPSGMPAMTGATCLRALTAEQVRWLALQEGFAGYLSADENGACWERLVDFQPASPPDLGRLAWRGDVLLEEGIDDPYIEHWQRVVRASGLLGLRLVDPVDGTTAVLARRRRHVRLRPLARGADRGAAVDAGARRRRERPARRPGPGQHRALTRHRVGGPVVDRELLLPYRVGADLAVDLDGTQCRTRDLTPDGDERLREWRVVASD